jgi:uncharacterized protein (DUF1697 family)
VQSGNVAFRSAERDLTRLARRIEDAVGKSFEFAPTGFPGPPPKCRTPSRAILPSGMALKRANCWWCSSPPARARQRLEIQTEPEEMIADRRELYIYYYYPNGMARPKLNFGQVERALKTGWTARNWNTAAKLYEMAAQ